MMHPIFSSVLHNCKLVLVVFPDGHIFVSFLGHPAPQVVWYKDDVQLDRYCGLPKYEIFRNGQNHSLHIYKYV